MCGKVKTIYGFDRKRRKGKCRRGKFILIYKIRSFIHLLLQSRVGCCSRYLFQFILSFVSLEIDIYNIAHALLIIQMIHIIFSYNKILSAFSIWIRKRNFQQDILVFKKWNKVIKFHSINKTNYSEEETFGLQVKIVNSFRVVVSFSPLVTQTKKDSFGTYSFNLY